MKVLTLTNPTYKNDKITIVKQKRYIYFHPYIDSCGVDFQIDIEKLKEFLK